MDFTDYVTLPVNEQKTVNDGPSSQLFSSITDRPRQTVRPADAARRTLDPAIQKLIAEQEMYFARNQADGETETAEQNETSNEKIETGSPQKLEDVAANQATTETEVKSS